jgi:hypothetical protein
MSDGESAPFIDESRATHPAWMYRDREQMPMGISLDKSASQYRMQF